MLMMILTATLASIGTAGVPGAGMVMLAMVLTSVGLPVDGIATGCRRGPYSLMWERTVFNIAGDVILLYYCFEYGTEERCKEGNENGL